MSDLYACIADVWNLLERIGQETTDLPGITRAAWSRNDERAADGVGSNNHCVHGFPFGIR